MHRLLAVPLALALVLAVPTSAAPTPAQTAATWLAARVTSGGYVAGMNGAPDPGSTVVTGLALAAAHVAPATVKRVATYLGAHIDDYARSGDADRPGALGRLALFAHAAGLDPNAFGGTAPTNRLIDRILATRTVVGPYAGLLADPVYNGLFSHSLGLLGVATARSLTADQQVALTQATDFLVAQQCPDGGWQNTARPAVAGIALTSCAGGAQGPDTNVDSVAVQALAAHRATPRVDPLGWLDAAQNSHGGYGYQPGGATDADSTALAIQAILAAGGSPTSARFTAGRTTARAALLALQLGASARPADRGAFAYMAGPPLRPNLYATAEAVPAAASLTFPFPSSGGTA